MKPVCFSHIDLCDATARDRALTALSFPSAFRSAKANRLVPRGIFDLDQERGLIRIG